jgi:lysophospholipase L1-like esterase
MFLARVDRPRGEKLYVIGDSVSAGIQGPNEATWPRLLAERCAIDVNNLAESGATVATAIRQARQIGDGPGLVLLEIGGNDLFAPTPTARFREDLDRLLRQVTGPNRTVVMLELPLLPWQMEYGRIQRQVARSHGVILVPKRFFVRVLRHKGATLDLAHLSSEGHRKMANEVAALLSLGKNPS